MVSIGAAPAGQPQWYVVLDENSNAISIGTMVASTEQLAAAGYTAQALTGNPSGLVWTAATKTFGPPPNPTVIATLAFIQRFTAAEYAGLVASTDPNIMFMIEQVRHGGGSIDLTGETVVQGLAYAASINLLTQARATTIGTP